MDFICYSHIEDLPSSADKLFTNHEKKSIYFSRLWYETVLNNGLGCEAVLFACVVDDNKFLAILPLMEKEPGHFRALSHLYTYLTDLLIETPKIEETINCLAEGLDRLLTKSVWIEPTDSINSNLEMLKSAMERYGYSSQQPFKFFNWIHRTNGQSFQDYLSQRPSRVRNTLARKRRKLLRERNYKLLIYHAADSEKGISDFNRIYRSSWKAFEQYAEFSDDLARRLAKAGWLRLGILYIDNEPAAGQFWFVVGGKASIFKLAYDEKWKAYSPGTILIAELMEHVIDKDQVEEIDFLMGNDSYKQDWMSERRSRNAYYFSKTRDTTASASGLFDRLRKTLLPIS